MNSTQAVREWFHFKCVADKGFGIQETEDMDNSLPMDLRRVIIGHRQERRQRLQHS